MRRSFSVNDGDEWERASVVDKVEEELLFGGGGGEGADGSPPPPSPPLKTIRVLTSDLDEIATHYDAVVIDYEGCVVNDSFARWTAFRRAAERALPRECAAAAARSSFAEWRADPARSTLGGFVWGCCRDAGAALRSRAEWRATRERAAEAYRRARGELLGAITLAPGVVDFLAIAGAKGLRCVVRGDATLWADAASWLEEAKAVAEAQSAPTLSLLQRARMSDPDEVAAAAASVVEATASPPDEAEYLLRKTDVTAFLRDLPGWLPPLPQTQQRPRVLAVVDCVDDCDACAELGAAAVAAPWGAGDPYAVSVAHPEVPVLDPCAGYSSLLAARRMRQQRQNAEKNNGGTPATV